MRFRASPAPPFCNIRKDSVEGLADFECNYFDFIYIDANHSYDFVLEDLCNWMSRLKEGGILSGHDYNLPDVKRAVDECSFKWRRCIMIDKGARRCAPSWYILK